MKNNKNKESTFEKSLRQAIFLSSVFGICTLLIFSMYRIVDTVIERACVLVLGSMFLFPLIPITVSFMINFIIGSNKQSDKDFKDNKSSSVNVPKPTQKINTESNKPKLKVVTTEGYIEFNNILKSSVQQKLMNRETILKLKCELRYRLGVHVEVYKDFKFQNDLHEIYTLSKSSVLTKGDYEYLTQFVSNNLIFPKEA